MTHVWDTETEADRTICRDKLEHCKGTSVSKPVRTARMKPTYRQ